MGMAAMLAGAVTAQIGPRMAALPRFWKIPAVQEATPLLPLSDSLQDDGEKAPQMAVAL